MGEWLQINLGATYSIRHYSLSIGIADFNKIPVSWALLASNDGSTWSMINTQTLSLTTSPASLVGNKYVVFFTMSDTYASSHQYYRFVFQSILGAGSTQVQISDIDLFVENPNHILRAGTRISMTKNWFKTSVFTGYSNIVQYKTLTNVPITNDVVNSRYLDQVNLSIQNKEENNLHDKSKDDECNLEEEVLDEISEIFKPIDKMQRDFCTHINDLKKLNG